jgi:hypothetical protein
MPEEYDDTLLLEPFDPPAWLIPALESARVPSDFRQRCQHAATSAYAIAKMRRERGLAQRFVDLPLAAYIEGLAQLAGADLSTVLEYLGVLRFARLDAENVRGIVRLCKSLGLSLRETMAHFRIEFAAAQGIPFSLLAARRGHDDQSGGLESCEAALTEAEANYPLSVLSQINELERAIHAGYREPEG